MQPARAPRSPGAVPRPGAPVLLAALLALGTFAAPVAAQESGWGLALSAGLFDVFEEREAAEAGVELALPPRAWRLQPVVGVMVNADEAVVGYAGLRREFELAPGWAAAIGFAVAAWEQGESKDLGSTLEFRSSGELTYRVTPRSRLGLEVYHLSNAGIDETNPGANSLVLVYRFDL